MKLFYMAMMHIKLIRMRRGVLFCVAVWWLELFRVKSMCMECFYRYMGLLHMAIIHNKLVRVGWEVFCVYLVVIGVVQDQ
jgi:uncharacterized membrane protein